MEEERERGLFSNPKEWTPELCSESMGLNLDWETPGIASRSGDPFAEMSVRVS